MTAWSKIEKRLVADWKQAYRWFSVHAMLAGGAMQMSWAVIPEDIKTHLPQYLFTYGTIGVLILGVFLRVVDQPQKAGKNG